MYKVIVVDDEPIVIMGIKSCIHWEEEGYIFAGQAQNGKEALELIEEVRPDIILTDIKMPYMDGMELLKVVTRDFPDCKVVVLSCLSEMEVVREALVMGAADYILKLSMQPEELIHILNRTAEKLESSRKQMLYLKNAEKILVSHNKKMEKELYYDFLNGRYSEEIFMEHAKNYKIILPEGRIILAAFQVYRIAENEVKQNELWKESEQILDKIVSQKMQEFILFLNKEFLIFLCSMEKIGNNSAEIKQYFKELQKELGKYAIGINTGIAKSFEGLFGLRQAYEEAVRAVDYHFYMSDESVIMAGSIPQIANDIFIVPLSEEKRIFEAIVEGRVKEAENIFHLLLQEAKQKRMEAASVKAGTEKFCYGIICLTDRMYGSAFHELEEIDYRTGISETMTFMQLERAVFLFIKRIEEYIQRNTSESCRKEIALAKQYVYTHMDEEITLEKIAAHVSISKSYFSMLFKQTEKESFTHFVNRSKMEMAKQLLMTQQLHIYEVAEKVGIENENYFTKLFKKYIGVNPSKFISDKKEKYSGKS